MPDIHDVKRFLARHGVPVLEFDVETPTAEAAALAVGCTPAEIAKSIVLVIGGEPVLVVTSGDMKVNSSMLKKATGCRGKVTLPSAEQVTELTGYAPGGVCPFLLPESLPVYFDLSLKRFETVYPAAGNSYSAVPVTFALLGKLVPGIESELCRPVYS